MWSHRCWASTVFLTLFACPSFAQEASSAYYPLKIGNAWTYRIGEGRFTMSVESSEKIGGVEVFRLEMRQRASKDPIHTEQIGYSAKGELARYSFDGKKASVPIVFFKSSPKAGTTWTVESTVSGQKIKGTFKVGTAKIKVLATTYDTITVTGQNMDVNGEKLNVTYYFAENVGLVKQEVELAGQKIMYELEKFVPAKDKK